MDKKIEEIKEYYINATGPILEDIALADILYLIAEVEAWRTKYHKVWNQHEILKHDHNDQNDQNEHLEKEYNNLRELLKESETSMERECKLYNELSTKYTKLQRVVRCAEELQRRLPNLLSSNYIVITEETWSALQQAIKSVRNENRKI